MNDSNTKVIKNTILVVDDQPQNVRLIGTLLRVDYNLLVADNGEKAIKSASEKHPDLILLDIMMPEMSGFEVCEILKSNPTTKDIPIIFLTAKTEQEDILKAFEIGGVDYITKPFHAQEVMARIRTHLELKNSKDIISNQNEELQIKNSKLEQAQKILTQKNEELLNAMKNLEAQAQHLNKLYSQLIQNENVLKATNDELVKINQEKDKFFSIISHDLRSPFAGFVTLTDLITKNINAFTKEELLELIESLNNNAQSTYSLLEDLLEWARSQMGRIKINIEKVDIATITYETLYSMSNLAEQKEITLEHNIDRNTFVECDRNMISTVVRNIISNAIKFTNINGKITLYSEIIETSLMKKYWRVSVEDTGVGMSDEQLKNLFSLSLYNSTTGTANEKGTGLGLVISNDFIQKMNGRMWVESQVGKGSVFHIELPFVE